VASSFASERVLVPQVQPDQDADEGEHHQVEGGVDEAVLDHRVSSLFRGLSRAISSKGRMKTKAMAAKAMMARTVPTSPESIMASPRAARTAPQMSLLLAGGSSFPPVENMDSKEAALTTLVTRNRKAATTVNR
jgi:hypothetical protein